MNADLCSALRIRAANLLLRLAETIDPDLYRRRQPPVKVSADTCWRTVSAAPAGGPYACGGPARGSLGEQAKLSSQPGDPKGNAS